VNQNPSQNTVRKAWRAALLVSLLVSVTQIQAQTQAAMNAQARAEFVKVDAELNRTYEALLAKLPHAESKEKLKQSQRAWVAFRDAEATFAADQARGGSMPIQQLSTPTRCEREAVRASRRRVSFSLKFDDAGNWRIVKTHQMSQKEVKHLETEYLFFRYRVLKQISTQWLENLLPPLNW